MKHKLGNRPCPIGSATSRFWRRVGRNQPRLQGITDFNSSRPHSVGECCVGRLSKRGARSTHDQGRRASPNEHVAPRS